MSFNPLQKNPLNPLSPFNASPRSDVSSDKSSSPRSAASEGATEVNKKTSSIMKEITNSTMQTSKSAGKWVAKVFSSRSKTSLGESAVDSKNKPFSSPLASRSFSNHELGESLRDAKEEMADAAEKTMSLSPRLSKDYSASLTEPPRKPSLSNLLENKLSPEDQARAAKEGILRPQMSLLAKMDSLSSLSAKEIASKPLVSTASKPPKEYSSIVTQAFSKSDEAKEFRNAFVNSYRYFDSSENMMKQLVKEFSKLSDKQSKAEMLKFAYEWASNPSIHEGDLPVCHDALAEMAALAASDGLEREAKSLGAILNQVQVQLKGKESKTPVMHTGLDETMQNIVDIKNNPAVYKQKLNALAKEINESLDSAVAALKTSNMIDMARGKFDPDSPYRDIATVSDVLPNYLKSLILEPGTESEERSGKKDAEREALIGFGLDLTTKLIQSRNFEAAASLSAVFDTYEIKTIAREKNYAILPRLKENALMNNEGGLLSAVHDFEMIKKATEKMKPDTFIPIIANKNQKLILHNEKAKNKQSGNNLIDHTDVKHFSYLINGIKVHQKKNVPPPSTDLIATLKSKEFDVSSETINANFEKIRSYI